MFSSEIEKPCLSESHYCTVNVVIKILDPTDKFSNVQTDTDRVADDDSHQRLLSATTAALFVPRMRLSTVGDRAFPVVAAFKRRLKTVLRLRGGLTFTADALDLLVQFIFCNVSLYFF